MSMLDVARGLHFSNSIDHLGSEERFMNLSMANSGRLFSCLQADRFRRDVSGAYSRVHVRAERRSLFVKER